MNSQLSTESALLNQQDDKELSVEKEERNKDIRTQLLLKAFKDKENKNKYDDISSEFNQY